MVRSSMNVTRSALPVLVLGFSLVASVVGCANLIGVKEGEWDGKFVDEATDIRTTELCLEYCDEVMENCTGEFAVYVNRASCLYSCNALPVADERSGEPDSNTVQCRLERAKAAAERPDEACPAASPGGANECGSNCESWCLMLEAGCPEQFDEMADCEQACTQLAQAPGFNIAGGYELDEDNVQCRISHLGAALAGGSEAELHCPHTAFETTGNCVGESGGEFSCDVYCQRVMAACQGDNLQYEDSEQCLAACEALPLGRISEQVGNNIGCRHYHAGNALSSSTAPGVHCPHAGPTGDGTCGATDTGICESYCALFAGGCPEAFDAEFSGDFRECSDACLASGLDGTTAGSQYTHPTALETDGIACRIRRSIKAALVGPIEGAEECLRASIALEGRVDCTTEP